MRAAQGLHGTDWIPRAGGWGECLDGEKEAILAVTGSQTPSFLPSPQQGHVCQTPRASLGWQTMCLCPRAPPPHPLQISPVQAGRPRPGCQYPGLPGLGVEDAWWTHLHPRVPGRVSYFLETKMYKEVRGGNKRGRRSEPQGREAREPFSPPATKGPREGTPQNHRRPNFHTKLWASQETPRSHWEAALGLALISLHSCDVQRVLKGRVSILQMDPQKIVPPSSPRPATSAKQSPEEPSAASRAGQRPRSQRRLGMLCFKLADGRALPLVTITRLGGKRECPVL